MASWRTRKKIGFALVVCGIIVIIVGVVIGRVLPSKLQSGITELVCVDSKSHPQYKDWVGPSTAENLIYHWHIANKDDFLYKGATPRFEERGPYVYTEEARKIDDKFDTTNHQVSFKTFTKQTFDAKRTAELCQNCKENDTLSVLNSVYLGFLEKSKGADNFGKAFISPVVSSWMNQLSDNENITLEQLARKKSPMSSFPNSTKFNPMFGSWVTTAGHGAAFSNANFTTKQMRALYGILRNSSRLGPPENETVLATCSTNPCLPECGFMFCLGAYAKLHSTSVGENITKPALISGYLSCSDNSNACYNFTNTAQLLVLARFVLKVLPAFVHYSLDTQNYGLVTTRSQRDLALGYTIALRLPGFPVGLPAPGAVTNHNSEGEARQKAKEKTFYTCKASAEKQYQWAKFSGSDEVDQAFFPNATAEQRKVRGYSRQFPGAKSLEACNADYAARQHSYEIFLNSMRLRVNIAHEKSVQIEGLKMDRYGIDAKSLAVDGIFVPKKGLLDVSRVFSLPAYMSQARFYGGDSDLWKKWNISQPEPKKHATIVDIEPVSGTVMNANFRVQFNVAMSKTSVPSHDATFRVFNISGLQGSAAPFSHVFPVFWQEVGGTIGSEDAGKFKSQVFGTLRASCAVMVTFVVIGVICFIVGLVLVVFSYKKDTAVTTISTDD